MDRCHSWLRSVSGSSSRPLEKSSQTKSGIPMRRVLREGRRALSKWASVFPVEVNLPFEAVSKCSVMLMLMMWLPHSLRPYRPRSPSLEGEGGSLAVEGGNAEHWHHAGHGGMDAGVA